MNLVDGKMGQTIITATFDPAVCHVFLSYHGEKPFQQLPEVSTRRQLLSSCAPWPNIHHPWRRPADLAQGSHLHHRNCFSSNAFTEIIELLKVFWVSHSPQMPFGHIIGSYIRVTRGGGGFGCNGVLGALLGGAKMKMGSCNMGFLPKRILHFFHLFWGLYLHLLTSSILNLRGVLCIWINCLDEDFSSALSQVEQAYLHDHRYP